MKNAIERFFENERWGSSRWDQSKIDDFMDKYGFMWDFIPGNYKSIPFKIFKKVEQEFNRGHWNKYTGKSAIFDILGEAQIELQAKMIKSPYDENESSPETYINNLIKYSIGNGFERIINRGVPRRVIEESKEIMDSYDDGINLDQFTKSELRTYMRRQFSQPIGIGEKIGRLTSNAADPLEKIIRKDDKSKVLNTLYVLEGKQYRIKYLEINGKMDEEIAKALDIKVEIVRVYKQRANEKLRKIFQGFYICHTSQKILINKFKKLVQNYNQLLDKDFDIPNGGRKMIFSLGPLEKCIFTKGDEKFDVTNSFEPVSIEVRINFLSLPSVIPQKLKRWKLTGHPLSDQVIELSHDAIYGFVVCACGSWGSKRTPRNGDSDVYKID